MNDVAKHLQAALSCEASGDMASALVHYRLLQARQPDHPNAGLRLAQAARAVQQFDEAEHQRRQHLKRDAANKLFAEITADKGLMPIFS